MGPSDNPPDNIAALKRRLLRRVIRLTALFLVLLAILAIPVAANRPGGGIAIAFGGLMMISLPWLLERRNHVRAASFVFLVGGALPIGVVYWFGRGVFAPAIVLEVGLVVHAAMLLERQRMWFLAAGFLILDLIKIVLQLQGMDIPIYFPGTPLVGWLVVAMTLLWLTPVLHDATHTMESSLEAMRRQVMEVEEANRQLKESEQLRESISETTPMGIVVFDGRGRSVYANLFAIARLGPEVLDCSRDALPWRCMDYSGRPLAETENPLQVSASGGHVQGMELAIERTSGQRICLSVSAAPLPGEKGGIVISFEDVTQRVQLERRYVQSQRLASMGRLAGFLAHDFNNLLTVIRGDSKLALSKAEDDSQRDRLERIFRSSDQAATICRQLLLFARQGPTPSYPLDLNELVQEQAHLLRGLLPSNIRLSLNLAPGLLMMRGESTALLQLLMNLVVNARDAMPGGGNVAIRTETHPSGEGSLLIVEDTGAGMDEVTLERIFEPYFTTKDLGHGTGLGLAIVYGVVQDLGGSIRVESQPGEGTQFLIHFPAVSTAPVPVGQS